ncbi:MAG: hypothetical protein ACYCWW_00175 [Deltaproteobacteria bacterium]
MIDAMKIDGVLDEVFDERVLQDIKHGEQNCPDGTGGSLALTFEAIVARSLCEANSRSESVTWMDIANEEVKEAFAERNPTRLRAELVQCAAVFVGWIEAIDRRSGT